MSTNRRWTAKNRASVKSRPSSASNRPAAGRPALDGPAAAGAGLGHSPLLGQPARIPARLRPEALDQEIDQRADPGGDARPGGITAWSAPSSSGIIAQQRARRAPSSIAGAAMKLGSMQMPRPGLGGGEQHLAIVAAQNRRRPRTVSQRPLDPEAPLLVGVEQDVVAGEVGRAFGPAARVEIGGARRPHACAPARSGARPARESASRPIRTARSKPPPARSTVRSSNSMSSSTRGWAAAKSASAGARWATPKESGAVSRIGPAIWVTASATTSSRRLELGEDVGGARIIGLADLGRLGAARGAGQQPRAELLLEPRDAAR